MADKSARLPDPCEFFTARSAIMTDISSPFPSAKAFSYAPSQVGRSTAICMTESGMYARRIILSFSSPCPPLSFACTSVSSRNWVRMRLRIMVDFPATALYAPPVMPRRMNSLTPLPAHLGPR